MTIDSKDMHTSSPGIALGSLLRHSKAPSLRQLLDDSVVSTLEQLDPTLLEGDSIGRIAEKLIEPTEALRDPDIRVQLIDLLPLMKARELAEKLNVDGDRFLYVHLRQAVADQSSLSVLNSFFGVADEERAPLYRPRDLTLLRPHYSLFNHQRVAATRVLRMLSEEPRKVVLHMPTGSGKTRTAMHVVASHLRDYEPTVVVWLAQSAELLEQAASEFETSWSHIGNRELTLTRFWGNRRPDVGTVEDGLIVAGLGKLHSLDRRDPNLMLRLADRTSLNVIDEAHQALAPTYRDTITALHTKRPFNALLGLTATPGRTWADVEEDEKLSDMFDRRKVTLEVEGYSDPVTFLIEEGFLAKPNFRTLNSGAGLDLTRRDVATLARAVDVPNSILERLGADTQRNLKILTTVEDLAKRHTRIIVFTPSVQNAKLLAALLGVRGYAAESVTALSSSHDRDRLIRRFRSPDAKPMILCNYGVLTTGFDVPQVSAAVIGRPTRSLVLYSQMVGRATRGPNVGGNTEAEIVTVVDPHLPGFGSIVDAFANWEDVWNDPSDHD